MAKTIEQMVETLEDLSRVADEVEAVAPQLVEAMRTIAVQRITDLGAVDTGNLRNSIQTESSGFCIRESETDVLCGISTGVEYARYIEYGTGPKGDPAVPHTDKPFWFQKDPDGDGFIVRYSQAPRPFMRPALQDEVNRQIYRDIIAGRIREVFG